MPHTPRVRENIVLVPVRVRVTHIALLYIRIITLDELSMTNYKRRKHESEQKARKTAKNNTKNAKMYTVSRSMTSIFDIPLVLSVFF